MKRGQIWWAELPEPTASEPGYKRPLLIVQADEFNRSRINTVIAAVITSNLRLADAPGNVRLSVKQSNLKNESVTNVSQVITLDKQFLVELAGKVDARTMREVDEGLRLALGLQ